MILLLSIRTRQNLASLSFLLLSRRLRTETAFSIKWQWLSGRLGQGLLLKDSQDFIISHQRDLCPNMWVPQDHACLSQAFLRKLVNMSFYVIRCQHQPEKRAMVVGQCRLGQAPPHSMCAAHDGRGLAPKRVSSENFKKCFTGPL